MTISSRMLNVASDQQIRLLQQQVATLQEELTLAKENLETVLKLTDTWATKLSSIHNTQFPTLRSVAVGASRKFIFM